MNTIKFNIFFYVQSCNDNHVIVIDDVADVVSTNTLFKLYNLYNF